METPSQEEEVGQLGEIMTMDHLSTQSAYTQSFMVWPQVGDRGHQPSGVVLDASNAMVTGWLPPWGCRKQNMRLERSVLDLPRRGES